MIFAFGCPVAGALDARLLGALRGADDGRHCHAADLRYVFVCAGCHRVNADALLGVCVYGGYGRCADNMCIHPWIFA